MSVRSSTSAPWMASDGLAVMPLVIVAVVVAYVTAATITPAPTPQGRHGAPGTLADDHASLVAAGETSGPASGSITTRRRGRARLTSQTRHVRAGFPVKQCG